MFDGQHFDREVIILCVLWYLRYKLSMRDLVFRYQVLCLIARVSSILRCPTSQAPLC
ncbi:MAG: putative transposase [Caballeronia sp.]|nr:putative transposase [Caballeronia sp.]